MPIPRHRDAVDIGERQTTVGERCFERLCGEALRFLLAIQALFLNDDFWKAIFDQSHTGIMRVSHHAEDAHVGSFQTGS